MVTSMGSRSALAALALAATLGGCDSREREEPYERGPRLVTYTFRATPSGNPAHPALARVLIDGAVHQTIPLDADTYVERVSVGQGQRIVIEILNPKEPAPGDRADCRLRAGEQSHQDSGDNACMASLVVQ